MRNARLAGSQAGAKDQLMSPFRRTFPFVFRPALLAAALAWSASACSVCEAVAAEPDAFGRDGWQASGNAVQNSTQGEWSPSRNQLREGDSQPAESAATQSAALANTGNRSSSRKPTT